MIPGNTLPTITPLGNVEGELRRDRAHTILHVKRPELIRRIQRAHLTHLLECGPASSDAVRSIIPIPAGIDPRVVGAAIRALALDRLIISTDRERSRRPAAHARWLDIWSIVDRSVAARWLICNPELPDPETTST